MEKDIFGPADGPLQAVFDRYWLDRWTMTGPGQHDAR